MERLVMLPLVGGYPDIVDGKTNIHSSLPSTLDKSATRRCHFPYSDIPRLLPLSHQSLESVYTLENAKTHCRFSSRWVISYKWYKGCLVNISQYSEEHDQKTRKRRERLQAGEHSKCREVEKMDHDIYDGECLFVYKTMHSDRIPTMVYPKTPVTPQS